MSKRKNQWLKKIIQEEKNIQIRVRFESKLKRYSAIILGIILSGSFFGFGWKVGTAVTFFFLLALIFFDFIFLTRFEDYTDRLIRRESYKK